MANQGQPVDWRLTTLDLEAAIRGYEERIIALRDERDSLQADVDRLQEYERRWRTLERLAHHWRLLGVQSAAVAVELGMLLCARPWLCARPGHDCATWQTPVETDR